MIQEAYGAEHLSWTLGIILRVGQSVSNPSCQTQDMKMENIIVEHSRIPSFLLFGEAKLVQHSPGHYELIGGTEADRMLALEWASFFGHEIMLSPAPNSP